MLVEAGADVNAVEGRLWTLPTSDQGLRNICASTELRNGASLSMDTLINLHGGYCILAD